MNEKDRYSLADIRKQPRGIYRNPSEKLPELIMDEKYLMMQVALGDARELMKGKVVNVCMSVKKERERSVIGSQCPLLSLSEGCNKNLVMQNNVVSCPEGRGALRISSEKIENIGVNHEMQGLADAAS